MKFLNKVAVITGASRGLGEYIAGSFVKQGISKLIILARNNEVLSKTLHSLNNMRVSNSQKIIANECDISNMSDIERFSELCFRETVKIDILVNNASVFGPIGYFDDVNLNESSFLVF